MTNEIPSFRTCPVCKCAKLAKKVVHKALLDGREIKICGSCRRKYSARARAERKLLLEE